MLRYSRNFVFALLLAVLSAASPTWAKAPTRVVYTVSVADTAKKTYRVTAKAEGLTDPAVSFAIPAWTPGYYTLIDFQKDIANVSAVGPDGEPRAVKPLDPRTWQVATEGAKSVTIRYDLRASEPGYGFFRTYLDEDNGFVNGPAALMYVVDGKTAPCTVTYRVPAGWKVASANAPTAGDPNTFTAPDYDTLADQPADLGRFARYDRTLNGVPFSVVVVGAEGADHKPFVENVYKVSEAGMRVFGSAPFPRYVYHFRFLERGGGAGLEHLNSTVIRLPEAALRGRGGLSITAHEFAHAWNVKRVRPAALGPFDYTRAVRVKDLWWSEGVTEYYAPRLLLEAGLADRAYWLEDIAAGINQLQNNPARQRVTLEEASLKAWEGGSQGFGGLSYYNKGMLVGLLLDIEMRRRTNNRVGLDHLMRHLLRESERTGRGFPENGIEAAATRLTGTDFAPFFERALRSTADLPFKETLAAAGLEMKETVRALPFLGLTWNPTRDGLEVTSLVPDGPAQKARLAAGDLLTHVGGTPVATLGGGFVRNRKPGETVPLTIRRGAQTVELNVTLGSRESRTYKVAEEPGATPLERSILAAITGAPPAPDNGGAR